MKIQFRINGSDLHTILYDEKDCRLNIILSPLDYIFY
jgi:hypothetical protein